MFDNTKIVESTDANVKKLVFTSDDVVAEAVLYKYPTYKERIVICCSTQSGCPVGCRFCGTGDFFIRNLSSEEIIYQVESCMDIVEAEEDIRNSDKFQIMFMSMGEPMLNWDELKIALFKLDKLYPDARLLISSVGPNATKRAWSDLLATSVQIPSIGLQFSIHEAIQEKRDALIPMKAKLSLDHIRQTGEAWHFLTRRKPYFNYCVSPDNNSDKEADLLTEYFSPEIWETTLSVICEQDEGVAAANQRQRSLVEGFMDKMLARGHSVRMFDPAGQDDIGGGCGQLWFVQDWAKNHPSVVKRSHGSGLSKVHTPGMQQ